MKNVFRYIFGTIYPNLPPPHAYLVPYTPIWPIHMQIWYHIPESCPPPARLAGWPGWLAGGPENQKNKKNQKIKKRLHLHIWYHIPESAPSICIFGTIYPNLANSYANLVPYTRILPSTSQAGWPGWRSGRPANPKNPKIEKRLHLHIWYHIAESAPFIYIFGTI